MTKKRNKDVPHIDLDRLSAEMQAEMRKEEEEEEAEHEPPGDEDDDVPPKAVIDLDRLSEEMEREAAGRVIRYAHKVRKRIGKARVHLADLEQDLDALEDLIHQMHRASRW